MKLYSYWRSTAAYRVRIALALKGIAYELVPVHLVKDGGEQHKPDYKALNPQGLVPTLVDGEVKLGQSLAIIEYLEETYPEPALLPGNALLRGKIRQLAHAVSSDMHPLNNLRVLQYLKHDLGQSEQAKTTWYHHWLKLGFDAIESMLAHNKTDCCFTDAPSLADICLIPQLYNAHRFEFDMSNYPIINRIEKHCLSLDSFIVSNPDDQPDAS